MNGESRFLKEVPQGLLSVVKSPRLSFGEEVEAEGTEEDLALIYNVGDRIAHPKWGAGEIMGVSGSGGQAILTVNFESVGEKSLMLKYAKLKPSPSSDLW